MAALRQQKDKTISRITAKGNVTLHPNKFTGDFTMNNYFRITAYHPEQNISVIMDSYGKFEKLWQFSAYMVQKGFKVLAVGNDETFFDGNIAKETKVEPNKIILQAYTTGKPTIENGKVEVNGKFYTPNN